VPVAVTLRDLVETPPVMPPVTAPKGWTKLDAGGKFTIYAPPGSYYHPQQDIDSFVGEIVTPDFTLAFDYGLYSNDLRGMASDIGYREQKFTSSGHPAFQRSNASANGARNMGVYVGSVHCGRLIIGIRCDWDALEMEGTIPAQYTDEAAAMFHTLEFPANLYE
jgi:hypothetical protein